MAKDGCLISCMADIMQSEGVTINGEAVNPLNLFEYMYFEYAKKIMPEGEVNPKIGYFDPESFKTTPRYVMRDFGFRVDVKFPS
jgi:hypothetical protein